MTDLMKELVLSIDRARQRRLSEIDHVVCCDPDTALCGADQTGEPPALGKPDTSKRMCTACAALTEDVEYKCSTDCPGGMDDE